MQILKLPEINTFQVGLSCITITYLENTRADIFWRKLSTYWIFVVNTTVLITIWIVVDLTLVLKLTILVTLCLGLISLLLDTFLNKLCVSQYEPVFSYSWTSLMKRKEESDLTMEALNNPDSSGETVEEDN